jgi:long-chain acyl-CoA synthetase
VLHAWLARSNPDGLALDDSSGGSPRTWAELADRTARLANWIAALGAQPGDHVAVWMGNRVECVELMIAGIEAGVWLTPINWHLTRDEIAYVIGDSGARVLFTDAAYAPVARELFAGPVVVAGEELESGVRAASDAPKPADAPAGGPMIYTSGTTGRPKGVKRHRAATLAAARDAQIAYARAIGLDAPGPHLITGPCYHAAPLMYAVYAQTNGAPVLVMPRWNEREALAVIQEREVGQTHLVPTMFTRLLRLPEEERATFRAPALSVVLHGAAPIARATKQRMIDWWGPVLVEYWGATESGVITLATSAEWLAHPETVGRVLPAFEVFAVDGDGRPTRIRSRSATSAASTPRASSISPTASRTRSSRAA